MWEEKAQLDNVEPLIFMTPLQNLVRKANDAWGVRGWTYSVLDTWWSHKTYMSEVQVTVFKSDGVAEMLRDDVGCCTLKRRMSEDQAKLNSIDLALERTLRWFFPGGRE